MQKSLTPQPYSLDTYLPAAQAISCDDLVAGSFDSWPYWNLNFRGREALHQQQTIFLSSFNLPESQLPYLINEDKCILQGYSCRTRMPTLENILSCVLYVASVQLVSFYMGTRGSRARDLDENRHDSLRSYCEDKWVGCH